MRILSWNVNGLRACTRKGFSGWLSKSRADIVGVQEVRALVEQLEPRVAKPRRWHTHFVAAERKGYSGVGLYSRHTIEQTETSLGAEDLDREGRLQIARIGGLTVANAYFPNGNGSTLPDGKRSNDRVPYKLRFYRMLFDRLEPERAAGVPIVVMGDFNTAHREIDLARPSPNRKTSGFLPEECAELDRWLEAGWTDTFRHLHPDAPGHYSWWSQRKGVREKNIGWRLDYVLASPGAMASLRDAFILSKVQGSDHCPVGVELDPAALG